MQLFVLAEVPARNTTHSKQMVRENTLKGLFMKLEDGVGNTVQCYEVLP